MLSWLLAEFKKDWSKLPNIITLTRLFLGVIPAIFLAIGGEIGNMVAFFAFIILICTDWIDGLIARKFNLKTTIGRIMDPIADRFITGLVIVVLIVQNIRTWLLLALSLGWFLLAALIISVLMFRALKSGVKVKPNISGKIKTVLISLLLICIIAEKTVFSGLAVLVPYLLVMAIAASIVSVISYFDDYYLALLQ